jgi:hypothetical protein
MTLSKDLINSAKLMGKREAVFLVNLYYTIQQNRIRTNSQLRSLAEANEPCLLLDAFGKQFHVSERQIKQGMIKYTDAHPMGVWLKSICGIGPVIAAGLLANIDITRAPSAGNIWSFAGLCPSKTWQKHTKRPWNADLKRLCYLIGESFVKVQSRETDFYGRFYIARKKLETEINNSGGYAELARNILATKNFSKDTVAYASLGSDKLPKAHIHARARRYAVKLFLSHLWQVWYFYQYGKIAPDPYVIAVLNHVHMIQPPSMELIPGLIEAEAKRGPYSTRKASQASAIAPLDFASRENFLDTTDDDLAGLEAIIHNCLDDEM